MPLPAVGDTPPAFTLPNQDGRSVSLAPDGKVVRTYASPAAPTHADEVLRDL